MDNRAERGRLHNLEKNPLLFYLVIILLLSIQYPLSPLQSLEGFDIQLDTFTSKEPRLSQSQDAVISIEDIPAIVEIIHSISVKLDQNSAPFTYSDSEALEWVSEFDSNLPILGIQEKIPVPENIGRIPFIYTLLGYRLYGLVSCYPQELQLSSTNISSEYILVYVTAHEFGHWALNHCLVTQFAQNISGPVKMNRTGLKELTEGSAQIFAVEMLSIETIEFPEKTDHATQALLFAVQTMLLRQLQLFWIRDEIPEGEIDAIKIALGPEYSKSIFSTHAKNAENSDMWYAEVPFKNISEVLGGQKISFFYGFQGRIQKIETVLPYFQQASQRYNELLQLRRVLEK